MNIKTTIFCGIFCLCTNFLYAQNKVLRGLIISGNGVEESFIAVEIYDSTFQTIKYIALEENNHFEVVIDANHSTVNVIVTKLGCDVFAKKVDFIESKTAFLTVQLENCTQQLQEVVVKAEQSFIKAKGDTLSFDVDGFKTKTDVNLGDILSRIPGVEISATNQILYQGKRVQQIWVQGRDILNNQHSLAIESLSAKDIENIQIVHEYKPFHKRFSQEHTENVAININLKEAAKGKITGEIEAFFGLENKYKLDGEAISVKSKNGSAIFLRSNNIGIPLIQPLEYLGLITDLSRLEENQSGEISIVPDALLPNSDAFKENQNLIASNSDFDIGQKTKGKVSFLGFYKAIDKMATVETDFFDTNASFTGKEEEVSRLPLLSSNINLKHEQSKNLLIELDMPILMSQQHTKRNRNGLYENTAYLSLFSDKERLIDYLPKLSINIRHQSNWTSNHTVAFDLKDNKLNKLYSQSVNDEPLYEQKLHHRHQSLRLLSSIENKYKFLLLKIWNRIEIGGFSTDFLTDNLLTFENDLNYSFRWRYWRPAIQYGIKNDNWTLHLQTELAQDYLNVRDESFRQTRFNPLFRFKYNWHLAKFIGFSLSKTQEYINQRNASNFYLIEDNLQIAHYALASGLSTRNEQVDFYFFDLRKKNSSSINCTFQYQQTKNALARVNSFTDNFVVSKIFLAPEARSGTFVVSLAQPFLKKKYQWKAKFQSTLANIQRTPFGVIDEQRFSIFTRFSTKWTGNWNAELGGKYEISEQQQEIIHQKWQTWNLSCNIRYKAQKWRASINYKWQLNQVAVSMIDFHQLDFNLNYLFNNRWSASLYGQDIFNLRNSQSLRLMSTPSIVEWSSYTRLQGSIMIGLKYSFR